MIILYPNMQFNDIVDEIIKQIAYISKFSYNEIKSVLMKERDSGRSDFCLFLNKISKTPEEDALELVSILNKHINELNSFNNKNTSDILYDSNKMVSELKSLKLTNCIESTGDSNDMMLSDRVNGMECPESANNKCLENMSTGMTFRLFKDVKNFGARVTFNLNKENVYASIITRINREGEAFGHNEVGRNKKVVVDFSSPNIAKVFHVGHFRTTVLGNFIVNLLRETGHEVVAMNYLGDWGKQFGLVLLGYERYGDDRALEENPLGHLCDLYVRISKEAEGDETVSRAAREIFCKMEENNDEKYLKQWRRFREISIKKYEELYKMLNIRFDVYSGESFYNKAAREFVTESNLCTKDPDGSYVIKLGNGLGTALVQKSDGSTLYLARDIVAAIDRIKKYEADELIYVVADEQNMHFRQLFRILEMLGYSSTKMEHINYGMIQKMSTRAGNVHFLEDVLRKSADAVCKNILDARFSNTTSSCDGKEPVSSIKIKDKIKENEGAVKEEKIINEEKEEIARILAVSTLLIADFSSRRIKGYVFDIEKRANCESGSGAYLQYAHCRLKSMETVNSEIDLTTLTENDMKAISSDEVGDFTFKLLWYEHILELCLEDFEPSRLVLYLMDLAKTVNNLIKKLKVKGEEKTVAKARLAVFRAARIVFNNAFKILGMTPLTKM